MTARGRGVRGLLSDPGFVAGVVLVGGAAAAAVFAPALSRWDPLAVDLAHQRLAPGAAHLLGTDDSGRDVLARILYGARLSLTVGLLARLVSTGIGLSLGLAAGTCRGAVESIVMRATDLVMAFPSLLLLIAVASAFGGSLVAVFLTLGLAGWGPTARLVRAQVLVVREEEFVTAGRAVGLPTWRLVVRHVLPNCLGPIVVSFTLGVATAILAESSLAFVGLGAQPPAPSWGSMAREGRDYLISAPWLALAPAGAIAVVAFGWNLLGDALRARLAPETRGTAA